MNTGFSGLLAIAILAIVLPTNAFCAAPVVPTAVPPRILPEIAYTDAHGEAKTVVPKGITAVHFWATWCVPCVAELPEIEAFQADYKDKGFRVIALSLDTSMDKVKQFFAQHRIKHLDANLDKGSFQAIQGKGVPTTVFMDSKGQIVGRSDGAIDWKKPETKAVIDKFIEQKP